MVKLIQEMRYMTLTKEGYKDRLIDKKINECLKVFGAVSINGPKWCGKTWTSLNHAKTVKYINTNDKKLFNLAQMDVNQILVGDYPILIDEWQLIPQIWDSVRRKCDEDKIKGKFILTGSAVEKENTVDHSGAGRICKLNMKTMSLYESGDSDGSVSLNDLFKNAEIKNQPTRELTLLEISDLILKGGWPENTDKSAKYSQLIAKSYIEDILDKDIFDDNIVKGFVNPNYYEKFIKDRAKKDDFFTNRESAVLFGIPSNLIEGILVGRTYEKDQNVLKEIKRLLPNCYICNLDGKVIKN